MRRLSHWRNSKGHDFKLNLLNLTSFVLLIIFMDLVANLLLFKETAQLIVMLMIQITEFLWKYFFQIVLVWSDL